jgi:hypothetical protein
MKVYLFNDWDENDNHLVKEITEDEILEDYWSFWSDKLI